MFKWNKYIFIILCALFCCMFTSAEIKAQNTERILNFHSDIKVDTTGRVLVTETIRINVTGESIKRGIVRSLPIYRTDVYYKKKRMDINILSVERDGEDETYSTNIEGDDFEVYIGNPDNYLSANIYEYTIQYEGYGHVGFFDNYDEIYWNVTGNDWAFDIDSVSATIHVPKGTKVISNACYTGAKGSTATDCNYTVEGDSIVHYTCSTYLEKGEGFTVATSFTSGVISHFSSVKTWISSTLKDVWSLLHNISTWIFLVITIYLSWFMVIVLKKPKLPIIIPSFNPPQGRTPAQLRYLYKGLLDSKALSASLVSLATKGAISIKKKSDGFFLTDIDQSIKLSAEEKVLRNSLFSSKENLALIGSKYESSWEKISNVWIKNITNKLNIKDYFGDKIIFKTTNHNFFKFTLCACCLLLSVITDFTAQGFESIGYIIGISIISIALLIRGIMEIKTSVELAKMFIVLSTLGLLGSCFLYFITKPIKIEIIFAIIFISICFITNSYIDRYYKRITEKGAKEMAEIEGFRMYLKIAEEHRLNFLTPPDRTPEQFEKMLPYAVALDLEIEWVNKFSDILRQYNYQSTWYEGGEYMCSYSQFSKSLSTSLTSTIGLRVLKTQPKIIISAESSSSSGSSSSSSGSRSWSSGSRGGGSSGGGGGGGGGRGW